MLLPFGTQTRLQKLLDSLRAHLFINQQDEETFITSVKDIVMKEFVDDTPISNEEPTAANDPVLVGDSSVVNEDANNSNPIISENNVNEGTDDPLA
jgi:hypothetical protein